MLKQDSRWNAFDAPVHFEDFCREKLPAIYLQPAVPEDVHQSFRVIKRLLQFSYFEYEFYDVAASRAMMTVEMAMRIKYKQLTGEDWADKKPLYKLIDWLKESYCFEIYNDGFLNHLRHIRNSMAHLKRHSFGGPLMNQWILHPMDIINDMYEDPILRYRRQILTIAIQDKLNEILSNGSQVTINGQSLILFHASVSLINNKLKPMQMSFYFYTIFEIQSEDLLNQIKIVPPQMKVDCHKVLINETSILGLFENGEICFELSILNKQINQDKYDSWLKIYGTYNKTVSHKQTMIMEIAKAWAEQKRAFHKIK